MEFSLKIGLLSLFFFFFFFFCKVILRWKWKLRNKRGVLEDFKRKYERKTSKRKERNEKRGKKEEKQKKKKKEKFFSLPSKTKGCFSGCLMSAASDQKLFCKLCSPFCCSFNEFVEEKVISPSYSSTILIPPSRIDAFELRCWGRLLRVSWTARRSNPSILKGISPECSLEGWCWSWNSNPLATSWEEPTHWKRPCC